MMSDGNTDDVLALT